MKQLTSTQLCKHRNYINSFSNAELYKCLFFNSLPLNVYKTHQVIVDRQHENRNRRIYSYTVMSQHFQLEGKVRLFIYRGSPLGTVANRATMAE